jgi:hypothetical protein
MMNTRTCNGGRIGKALILLVLMTVADVRGQYVNTVVSSGLFEPNGVAVDQNNDVFVTDSSNNRIVEFVPGSGAVTTLAGKSGPANAGYAPGPGASAQFSQPLGIVYSQGGLVVVDSANQVLRFVTLDGLVSTTVVGTPKVSGFTDGPGASAQFSYPTGIAADAAGNLYVADTGNNAIRRVATDLSVATISVTNNYKFGNPTAVAVDAGNNLWIADTQHDVICVISNIAQISNQVVTVIAGTPGVSGTNDSLIASNALFNLPSGLLAVTNDNSILISDTGNHTVRRLYPFTALGSGNYAVSTLAGIPGVSGNVNGALGVAEFAAPVGLSVDSFDEGFYVVDRANSSLRVLQTSTPQPPVQTPEIGYITPTTTTTGSVTSQFNAFANGASFTFNNLATIAIVADPTAQTYMTNVATSSDPFGQVSPTPGPGWTTAATYNNSDDVFPPPASQVLVLPTSGTPTNVTMYVFSSATGRASSIVVSNQFQFVTATPTIVGNNGAQVVLTDATTNPAVEMYYTLDGTTPTINSLGPISSGTILPPVTTNAVLTVFAVADGFAPSAPVSVLLSASNFLGNEMTFGFSSGEASSEFIAAAGQSFYAPVTMTLLPGTTMYSLQMNLFVTNFPGTPAVDPTTMRFDSFFKYPGETNGISVLLPIPPGVVVDLTRVTQVTNIVGTNTTITEVTNGYYGVTNGTFTNLFEDLLGVGWIERYPETNLYPTIALAQGLITYSQAHDITFPGAGGLIEVGSFSFLVPRTAVNGQTFQIALGSPSATTYPLPAENPVGVLISTVSNGSLTAGAINSIKTVTVGSARYLVGDAYPFRWFNAGDFGDGLLLDDDVIEVFQSAIYNFNTPPNTSDYYNTMDSSNGTDNNFYDGDDTTINNIAFGDGFLGVDDVYVTFRRSLDPSLTNYARFWSGGVLNAVAVPSPVPQPQTPPSTKPGPKPAVSPGPQYITVAADQVQGAAGSTVQVPVRVLSPSAYPVRVFMLNIDVVPLDGSPAVSNAVVFTANGNLGLPAFTASQGAANYAGAWLDSTVFGLSGAGVIGTLSITLPPNATPDSAYQIHFEHFSASPNGIALFHTTIQDGLVTLSDRSGSSWNDGIPDAWRLLYFGSVSNALSAANLDPDGDGASNWQEYVAGTNPLDATSVFQLMAGAAGPSGFNFQWPSVVNKNYTLESSPTLGSPNWSVVASNLIGNGQIMQWSDTNPSTANFYRAQVH